MTFSTVAPRFLKPVSYIAMTLGRRTLHVW